MPYLAPLVRAVTASLSTDFYALPTNQMAINQTLERLLLLRTHTPYSSLRREITHALVVVAFCITSPAVSGEGAASLAPSLWPTPAWTRTSCSPGSAWIGSSGAF